MEESMGFGVDTWDEMFVRWLTGYVTVSKPFNTSEPQSSHLQDEDNENISKTQ